MIEALRGRPEASADLIVAADAMVYVADLAPVLREVKRVLAPGGLLAFTVETHEGSGVILGEGLRYAHGGRLRTRLGRGCRSSPCRGLKICRPETRITDRSPVSWWSRRRP